MANPQKENGFTAVANEILEQIMKVKFNGTQAAIIMAIWRYTYGFQICQNELSITFIANAINSNKTIVKRELDKLIEKKIVSVEKANTNIKSRVIKFNKNYEEWLEYTNQSTPKSVYTNQYTPEDTKKYTPEDTKKYTNKENLKENLKENIPYAEIVDYLNLKANKGYKSSTSKTKDLIKARWNEKFILEDFKTVIDVKCKDWLGTDHEMYLRPETLFGNKFEGYLNQKPKANKQPTVNGVKIANPEKLIRRDDY